jgi:hypothetical protein
MGVRWLATAFHNTQPTLPPATGRRPAPHHRLPSSFTFGYPDRRYTPHLIGALRGTGMYCLSDTTPPLEPGTHLQGRTATPAFSLTFSYPDRCHTPHLIGALRGTGMYCLSDTTPPPSHPRSRLSSSLDPAFSVLGRSLPARHPTSPLRFPFSCRFDLQFDFSSGLALIGPVARTSLSKLCEGQATFVSPLHLHLHSARLVLKPCHPEGVHDRRTSTRLFLCRCLCLLPLAVNSGGSMLVASLRQPSLLPLPCGSWL